MLAIDLHTATLPDGITHPALVRQDHGRAIEYAADGSLISYAVGDPRMRAVIWMGAADVAAPKPAAATTGAPTAAAHSSRR